LHAHEPLRPAAVRDIDSESAFACAARLGMRGGDEERVGTRNRGLRLRVQAGAVFGPPWCRGVGIEQGLPRLDVLRAVAEALLDRDPEAVRADRCWCAEAMVSTGRTADARL